MIANRDPRAASATSGPTQWFAWVDINAEGELNVVFNDRRLDTDSEASEWPESRSQPGNYLTWLFGRSAASPNRKSASAVADEAEVVEQSTEPVDPGRNHVPGQWEADFPLRNLQVSDVTRTTTTRSAPASWRDQGAAVDRRPVPGRTVPVTVFTG